MESQPKSPEFRINPENFHPCWFSHVMAQILIVCIHLKANQLSLNILST